MSEAINIHGVDDSAPSELQSMIADSVERLFAEQVSAELLERFDAGQPIDALWQLVADNGLPGALVPEAANGSGATWLEASPVLRAIGYWQAPLALGETMLAGLLLAKAGLTVPEGPLSLIQTSRLGDLRLRDDGQLDGRAVNVPWARTCRWAAIADAEGRLALVDLRQDSISLEAGSNFAGEERDILVFTAARAEAVGRLQLADVAEPVWLFGALIRACMLVGALESTLDKAVAYANERVQFGKPIGKQQAIQQQLAHMAGSIGAARMATQVALRSASEALLAEAGSRTTLAFDVAVAKVCAGEAASLATSVAHQVFGAIGFTHEHTLHFATRRLWSWRDEFGSDAQWAKVLGEAAIAAGPEGFWAGLTARSL
ncbi:acyl-CoA/acyl-ACP dehydrogenase [Pseudomonas sp. LS44]|uniref:acyl-CoA dehydrogenase family protein n=1 Tax=Pseudomonas sp. LS44 TaxID=1357074 RepID=UPI00215A7A8E|nr:acyl-CoA dehydrogenase family protein [Pseudomonas sp. LS44]UVE18698.1 acyl-CoA/acyl-ACP dehydrogenase [Pseudomonas sp. LS44]